MTLLQRCQAVASKMEKLALAQRHANQQQLVQERAREWKARFERLQIVKNRAACLTLSTDAERRVDEKRGHLRHNAVQVLERLKSLDDIADLTSDASWTRLLACVEGLTEELESSGKWAWRTHIEELGAPEDPAWLRQRAPSTPANDAAIAAYEKHYSVYSGLARSSMPRGAGDLAQMSEALEACRVEAAKITFDVPPDVQRFFQAIQADRATLALLTPVVLEWLRSNEQLDHYRVRSAGR